MSMAEKKFYDFELSDTSLGILGVPMTKTIPGPHTDSDTIVDIPQGTSESQRIGRKCTITNILMRLNFSFILKQDNTQGTFMVGESHDTLRIILFWDKQCNGAATNADDILATDVFDSYRNLANKGRFVILYDKIKNFNTRMLTSGDGVVMSSGVQERDYIVKISKKVFIPIEYDSTTGDITEIKTNNIGLFVWAKEGQHMRLEASKCRIRFRDY